MKNTGRIMIQTYTDPKYLFADTGLDKNCIHVVPTQEMIQGHRDMGTYAADPDQGGWQFITTKTLENAFYGDWFGVEDRLRDRKLNQIIEVGEMLAELKPGMVIAINQSHSSDYCIQIDENLLLSMEHNTASMTKSLRKFSELGLKPDGFDLAGLCTGQLIAVYLYQQICRNPKSNFRFSRLYTREQVRKALDKSVGETIAKCFASNKSRQKQALRGYQRLCSADTIIFDSVFQLTPTMLSAIYDLKHAGYTVYLLINYRTEQELRLFYQCWLDMYALFDSAELKINIQQHPIVNMDNYKLALALGTVANGQYQADCTEIVENTRFYEFASVTEYANCVDRSFRKALETEYQRTKKSYQNTLFFMPEMHYVAARNATDILRAYHPLQFGDRTLLDYPLGKCLIGLVKMWNPEKKILEIKDFGLLGDCLRGYPSPNMDNLTNVNTYNTLRSYFDRFSTLDEIIAATERILEMKKESTEEIVFAYLSLHQLNVPELTGFWHTLQQINETAKLLFKGAEKSVRFYTKIKCVMEMLLGQETLDEKSRDMYAESLKALLIRARDTLEEVENGDEQTDYSISVENRQLRVMLDEILSITETESSSAKWIVRDLVQIDGDIFVRSAPDIIRTNHFGFLSDQDLSGNPDDLLPWPLDMRFFENIRLEDNTNTILQIYRQFSKSKQEFSRYALIYGLLFSRVPVTLSYVKKVGDEEREPYYLFRLLGLKPHRITMELDCKPTDLSPYEYQPNKEPTVFNCAQPEDSSAAQICIYRYVAERLINKKSWYTDRFSMTAYIKSSLIYLVLRSMELYYGNQFLPESREALDMIVRNTADEVLNGSAFVRLCSLGFLTEFELHEIRHDVTHQSQIRAYKLIKCICRKLYNGITSENPLQAFLFEPEVQILDHSDMQDILKNVPKGNTVSNFDRAGYFQKAVECYGRNTALYPNDSAYFDLTTRLPDPQQMWMDNHLYDRYEDFDVHKSSVAGGGRERYKCSLCTCKPFCLHGLTSAT